jgi:hypothetical protein
MQPAFDVRFPEVQEFVEYRKSGSQVQLLPNEALQEFRVVRHVIEDFGCRQPVSA